jgi:hypothetical protein
MWHYISYKKTNNQFLTIYDYISFASLGIIMFEMVPLLLKYENITTIIEYIKPTINDGELGP